jgi:leader peptidase (prepilin peptidase)/N-methyltransferase
VIETTTLRVAWAAGVGGLGLAVGSFLNVVIWRVPRRESLVRPGSRCPHCGAPVRRRDNVPLLSWVALRGRCRACRETIGWRYPLVEAGTAVLFGALAWHFEAHLELVGFLVLAATLVAVGVIDLEHYIVPNRILWPVSVASVAFLAAVAVTQGRGDDLATALLGAVGAFATLFLVHLASPRGMGMGDVKLAFLLGLYLGWIDGGHVALGLFAGFLLGAVAGVVLIATGLRGRRDPVPFAPFLGAGTLVAVLYGGAILDWYAGL